MVTFRLVTFYFYLNHIGKFEESIPIGKVCQLQASLNTVEISLKIWKYAIFATNFQRISGRESRYPRHFPSGCSPNPIPVSISNPHTVFSIRAVSFGWWLWCGGGGFEGGYAIALVEGWAPCYGYNNLQHYGEHLPVPMVFTILLLLKQTIKKKVIKK